MPAKTYTIECKYSPGDVCEYRVAHLNEKVRIEDCWVRIDRKFIPTITYTVILLDGLSKLSANEANLYPIEQEAMAAREEG